MILKKTALFWLLLALTLPIVPASGKNSASHSPSETAKPPIPPPYAATQPIKIAGFDDGDEVLAVEDMIDFDDIEDFDESIWLLNTSASLESGYKENILYSGIFQENAMLLRGEADLMLSSIRGDGALAMGYLYVENTRFLSAVEPDDETVVMAQVQWGKRLSDTVNVNLAAGYNYLRMFFDVSLSDLEQTTGILDERLYSFTAGLEADWGKHWIVDGNVEVVRNDYGESVNNSTEFKSGMGVSFLYGERSEVRLGYTWTINDYNSRLARTPQGDAISGTNLSTRSHGMELNADHFPDGDRTLRFQTAMSAETARDNHLGYNDFTLIKASEKLTLISNDWELSLAAGISRYEAANRLIPEDDIDYTATDGALEIRNRIHPQFILFFKAAYEDQHYDDLDDYHITSMVIGIQWER